MPTYHIEMITDVKRENWATGGKLWTEPRSSKARRAVPCEE